MQFAHLVLLSAVSAPVEESKPSVANPPTALPTVVRVDTILAKETTAGFDDEKQEAFLAAFAIVSNLNPGDTETLEIRAVKKATPSIGLVVTIEMGCNTHQVPDILKKLSRKRLDSSLASFLREPAGGVEVGEPQVFGSRFMGLRNLEKSDYAVILIAMCALLLFKKVQNDSARQKLLDRKKRRKNNAGGDAFRYTQDMQLTRLSHSPATEDFDDLEMDMVSWR
jgi:hypothetical protein